MTISYIDVIKLQFDYKDKEYIRLTMFTIVFCSQSNIRILHKCIIHS